MGEDYVIEVLSIEWIINSTLSLLYISIVLICCKNAFHLQLNMTSTVVGIFLNI